MNSSFTIRPVIDDDVQAITDIYNEAVINGGSSADIEPRTIEQRSAWVNAHTPREKYPVVVLEVNKENEDGTFSKDVAGFASLNQVNVKAGYDAVAEVTYYVGFAWYGMGIGTALLEWLIAAARERGFHKLTAGIFVDNEGSTKLMHKFGFAQYGLLPRASFNTRLNRSYDLAYWYKDI